MITPADNRRICAYYKVDGWEPRRKCSAVVNRTYRGCHCYICGADLGEPNNGWAGIPSPYQHLGTHRHKDSHEIPPPDLSIPDGAWKLLIAIWKRGYNIGVLHEMLQKKRVSLMRMTDLERVAVDIEADDVGTALALAALQLIPKDREKTV